MTLTEKVTRHFSGKTIILTGAASGIGRALTLRLATSGALVHAVDSNEQDWIHFARKPAGAARWWPASWMCAMRRHSPDW